VGLRGFTKQNEADSMGFRGFTKQRRRFSTDLVS